MYFHGIKLYSLKYPPIMLALCWHSTPVYYALYYAGIFHTSLALTNNNEGCPPYDYDYDNWKGSTMLITSN